MVKCGGEVLAAKRLFRLIHRLPGTRQSVARGLAIGGAVTGQRLRRLPVQLVAQGLLTIGKGLRIQPGLTIGPRLPLARLTLTGLPLSRLTLTRLTLARLTLIAGLAGLARLALRPLPRVELVLQVLERLIRKRLLFAQGVRQPLHGLTTGHLHSVRPFGHLHVLGQLPQTIQQRLRLIGAALLHQLLQAVHQLLHLVAIDGHLLLRRVLRNVLVLPVLIFSKLLCHVILQSLLHVLHKARDFFLAGPTTDRL